MSGDETPADGVVIKMAGLPPFGDTTSYEGNVFFAQVSAPLLLFPRGGGVMVIQGGRAEPLCTLRHVEGRWVAEYEPEHLDEAARIFMDALQGLIEQHGLGDQVAAARMAELEANEAGLVARLRQMEDERDDDLKAERDAAEARADTVLAGLPIDPAAANSLTARRFQRLLAAAEAQVTRALAVADELERHAAGIEPGPVALAVVGPDAYLDGRVYGYREAARRIRRALEPPSEPATSLLDQSDVTSDLSSSGEANPPRWHAPWTPDQVVALYYRQTNLELHPYTCPRPHEKESRLVATEVGWRCLVALTDTPGFCDYRQTWAFPEPLPPVEPARCGAECRLSRAASVTCWRAPGHHGAHRDGLGLEFEWQDGGASQP